jgi:LacI family transcriptional regulator
VSDAPGGGRRVTIRDVADAAAVHISTVSRALDPAKRSLIADDTRERVLAVVEELGYRPHLVASGLRRGRTRTIGVVVPDLGNPIYAPLTRGAAHVIDGLGFMPLVADTQDDHGLLGRVLRHLAERRADAAIVCAARLEDEDLLREIDAGGVPIVTAVRNVPASGLPRVDHDDELGGELAAEHLLALGHRRLGQLRGPLDVEPFRARSAGFAAIVAGASGAHLVADRPPTVNPSVEEGRQRALEFLGRSVRQRPTGLFVQSDTMAIGALQAVRELGLTCPGDVSIVSYNDAPFSAHTDPPLTTLRLDPYEIGRRAGQLALATIDGRDRTNVSLEPTLVVRASTSPPPTGSSGDAAGR